jgi:AcrR family transcriptional regulator
MTTDTKAHMTRTTTPRHAIRATRTAGRTRRSRLLDAASRLFRERGLTQTSIADVAAAADAFPSQVTYYFKSKDALFVEVACRDVLYLAADAERAAADTDTPATYTDALVTTVMGDDRLGVFVEAQVLARRRPDLQTLIARTIARLHGEGTRAYTGVMAARGWRSRRPADEEARRFWAIALGLTLEGHATGQDKSQQIAAARAVFAPQADVAARPAALSLAETSAKDGSP